MKLPNALIKFNGGRPIALCNRCFRIMCYVSCDDKDLDKATCKIIEKLGVNGKFHIMTPVGEQPPPFCDMCHELLFGYSLN